VKYLHPLLYTSLWLLAFSSAAPATPANKKAAANYYGHFLPEKLASCTLCHLPSKNSAPETLKDFPHNAFGDRLRVLGESLKKQHRDASLGARLKLVAAEDSDHDGVPNLTEILLGTNPGDAGDKPTPAALASVSPTQSAFASFRAQYAWEPFKAVQRPALPKGPAAGAQNPIDAFIRERQQAHGLTPLPDASPSVLARRIYLDLIGLVPTPEEVAAFESSSKRHPQTAVRVLVDQLLANARYGERWGRHFMDIWRYSDWDGYKETVRMSQPHIWRWRDWIIESLNADKPYSRMAQEMLAADEIAPDDNNMLRATGFLVRNFQSDRLQWMDNVVEHTSKAFMGLTMNCAKCHDHKYDPLAQTDYYHLRAVFEPYNVRMDPVPGEVDTTHDGLPRAYDQSLAPLTYLFQRGDERFPVKDKPMAPGIPAVFNNVLAVKQLNLPLSARQPEKRAYVRQALLDEARTAVETARAGGAAETLRLQAAKHKLKALEQLLQLETLEDLGMDKKSSRWQSMASLVCASQRQSGLLDAQQAKTVADAALTAAGETLEKAKAAAAKTKATKALAAAKTKAAACDKALAEARKAVLEPVKTNYTPRAVKTYPDASTGRRLAFAKWLTSPDNTLFARVAMNHLWLRHFGTGIVTTPSDFGANGRQPTHPALLDWLASEFMAQGCSLKQMHRLIMTSAVYRRASSVDASFDPALQARNSALDPDNVWLWHAPTRRMEGELVRDNLLRVAGLLDPTQGGPDIDNEAAETSHRRSLYLRQAPEKTVEFLQIFDGARPIECYQRENSIKPHQALALANSKLTLDASTALEKTLSAQTGADYQAFLMAAWQRILNRAPKPEEVRLCNEFMTAAGREPGRARQQVIGVLFNHNDFVTIR